MLGFHTQNQSWTHGILTGIWPGPRELPRLVGGAWEALVCLDAYSYPVAPRDRKGSWPASSALTGQGPEQQGLGVQHAQCVGVVA